MKILDKMKKFMKILTKMELSEEVYDFVLNKDEILFIRDRKVIDTHGELFTTKTDIQDILIINDRILVVLNKHIVLYDKKKGIEKFVLSISSTKVVGKDNILVAIDIFIITFFRIDSNFDAEYLFNFSQPENVIYKNRIFFDEYLYIPRGGEIIKYGNGKEICRLRFNIAYTPIFSVCGEYMAILKQTKDLHVCIEIYIDNNLEEILDLPEIKYISYNVLMRMNFNNIYILVKNILHTIEYNRIIPK